MGFPTLHCVELSSFGNIRPQTKPVYTCPTMEEPIKESGYISKKISYMAEEPDYMVGGTVYVAQ